MTSMPEFRRIKLKGRKVTRFNKIYTSELIWSFFSERQLEDLKENNHQLRDTDLSIAKELENALTKEDSETSVKLDAPLEDQPLTNDQTQKEEDEDLFDLNARIQMDKIER